jgi:thymidylate synthase
MFIHSDNFAEAWFELLATIHYNGAPVSPRGFETLELLGMQVRVDDMTKNILVHPSRALSYKFLVSEWLWIAAGRDDVASISRYNKNIAQFSDNGIVFAGAYGPRIASQMPWVIEQLNKPDSRQAVIQIWTPSPSPSKDIPCTLTWQLLARDGVLHAIVTMRSSDVWLGLPYDFFNFSQMTNSLAGELTLAPGSLIFNLGSSHLYERDHALAVQTLTRSDTLSVIRSPLLPGRTPASEILNHDDALIMPWSAYRNVLLARNNSAALEQLEALGNE